jgi:signal transduction histidine kinase
LERSAVRELPHDKHVLVRRMSASVGRLSGLCEGLLQYARIESGRLSLRTESLDVGQLASDVLAELRAEADEKGIELCLELDDGQAYLDADRELVRLILLHLVENGLRSTEQGQVRVSVSFDERSCRLTVSDTGPGIAREHQAHILDPLDQGEARRQPGGAMLGLSLVRQLVDALGGSITLTSRVGQGSKFSVRLPHRHSSACESPLHAVAQA